MLLTTLCYIENADSYLMLHRIKNTADVNKDKWIGIGGKFEKGESPEDCLLREAREETGLTLTDYRLHKLNLWEGDKIFFKLLNENYPVFSLKLVYENGDQLTEAVLDGRKLKIADYTK